MSFWRSFLESFDIVFRLAFASISRCPRELESRKSSANGNVLRVELICSTLKSFASHGVHFGSPFQIFLRTFIVLLDYVLDRFWLTFWTTFGSLFSTVPQFFGITFGPFLGHFWAAFGPLLGHFWATFGPLLGHFWTTFGPLLEHFSKGPQIPPLQ